MHGQMKLRLLAHSLTAFGHEAAAGVARLQRKKLSVCLEEQEQPKKAKDLLFFHRLRPPDKHQKI